MGNPGKNLEAGTEVEAMEELWLLACSHSTLRLLFYTSQGHLPRGDVTDGWAGPSQPSNINQARNSPPTSIKQENEKMSCRVACPRDRPS